AEDRWLFHLGLREYRIRLEQEPLSFLPFLIHKFARLWYGMDTGIFYKQFILGLCSLFTVPLGVLQIWLWRRERLSLSIVGILILYFVILGLISLPQLRYMISLYPFLLFAASHQYLKLFKVLSMRPLEGLSRHSLRFVARGKVR